MMRQAIQRSRTSHVNSAYNAGERVNAQNGRSTMHPVNIQQALGNQAAQQLMQPKLRINPPNDKYEQEANRVADQVTRMSEPPQEAAGIGQTRPPQIQRLCAECEEEMQRQPVEEGEEEILQAQRHSNTVPSISPNVQSGINHLRNGGRRLPASIRAFIEPRLAHDLSSVRLHSDSRAIDLAMRVNARAFTVGNHIFFNRGEFQPNTAGGKRLLAHELVHTVQQSTGDHGIQRVSEEEEEEPKILPPNSARVGEASPYPAFHPGLGVIASGLIKEPERVSPPPPRLTPEQLKSLFPLKRREARKTMSAGDLLVELQSIIDRLPGLEVRGGRIMFKTPRIRF